MDKDISFENGSKIKVLETQQDSKRGYIRCRMLTDEEYRRMIYEEQVQAERRVNIMIKELGL